MGLAQPPARSTLADALNIRDWRIYQALAQRLISRARALYAEDPLLDLDATVYALDATTIDLCLSLFPWAPFRQTKAAIKLHTLLDLRGAIPAFIFISDGKLHDVNVLDILAAGARRLLRDGSRLSRFRTVVCAPSGQGLLCYSRQSEFQMQAALLLARRSRDRTRSAIK